MLRSILPLAPLLVVFAAACALGQPGPEAVRDEPALLAAAERLLDGQLAPGGPDPDQRAWLWHGPGLVALLAPLVALELPLTAIRFVEPLLLGAAALLLHRLLRTRLPPRAALAGTYALGLYLPLYPVLGRIHKEPLSILLVVAGMLALVRGMAGSRPALLAAGAALAGLTMVRLEYGWVSIALLGLALAAWLVRGSAVARRAAVVPAVALALCVPWLAFTHARSGEPLYLSLIHI